MHFVGDSHKENQKIMSAAQSNGNVDKWVEITKVYFMPDWHYNVDCHCSLIILIKSINFIEKFNFRIASIFPRMSWSSCASLCATSCLRSPTSSPCPVQWPSVATFMVNSMTWRSSSDREAPLLIRITFSWEILWIEDTTVWKH